LRLGVVITVVFLEWEKQDFASLQAIEPKSGFYTVVDNFFRYNVVFVSSLGSNFVPEIINVCK
jgi:hypothetical protein